MSSTKNAAARSRKGGGSGGPFRKALHALLLAGWIAVPSIAQNNGAARPVGFPTDWSHNHLIFTDGGSAQSQLDAQRDPRYAMQWMRRNLPLWRKQLAPAVKSEVNPAAPAGAEIAPGRFRIPPEPERPRTSTTRALKGDWNFSLQTAAANGGVAPGQFPAKWTFDPIGAASCASDFVIYALNTGGGAGQANLVGVNNLYVGASGGCGNGAYGGGDDSTYPTPQVLWAFNVSTSPIMTSPVLSLDGTKVAYVVNTPTNPTLQVLTLPIGTHRGTVTVPVAPTTCNGAAPSICSVTLSSSGDSNSSLFVDYGNDVAYVGGDNGKLDKITGVFTGTPALAGGIWPVSAGSAILGPPVYDSVTGTVFVGSSDGNLYGFTSSGTGITGSPLALATSAGGSEGLNAPPIVDSTNSVLYAFYGDNATTSLAGCTSAGTCAQVAQVVYYDHTDSTHVEFKTSATAGTPGSASTAVAGTNLAAFLTTTGAATFVISAGAFSNGYYTSFPSTDTTSFLYACGATGGGGTTGVGLQQFGFNGSGQLSTTVTQVANITSSTAAVYLCSPATEFYNASTDYLFLSVPVLNEVQSYILPGSGGTNNSMTAAATNATVVGGASGIIVDGADTVTNNASSLYFTSESATSATCTTSGNANPANTGIGSLAAAICAYKLTQSALQ